MRADRVSVRENLLHDVRRRVSGDVEIFRRQTADHVAHTTACKISDVSVFAEALRDLTRGLFHWWHGSNLTNSTDHAETEKSGAIVAGHAIPFCMTEAELKGQWGQLRGKLKQKYGQLTDDDLSFTEGKDEELLGRLQQRLGKTKEEIRAEIEKL